MGVHGPPLLPYQGDVTRQQFGGLGRTITNTNCYEATESEKAKMGYITGYSHNESKYPKWPAEII